MTQACEFTEVVNNKFILTSALKKYLLLFEILQKLVLASSGIGRNAGIFRD